MGCTSKRPLCWATDRRSSGRGHTAAPNQQPAFDGRGCHAFAGMLRAVAASTQAANHVVETQRLACAPRRATSITPLLAPPNEGCAASAQHGPNPCKCKALPVLGCHCHWAPLTAAWQRGALCHVSSPPLLSPLPLPPRCCCSRAWQPSSAAINIIIPKRRPHPAIPIYAMLNSAHPSSRPWD